MRTELEKKLDSISSLYDKFYLLIGSSVVFILYFLWALNLPSIQAPDELMRNQIPFWIIENGKLPIGNEAELIHPFWGFSYAYSPYLPSLFSVFFIKLFSFFTTNYVSLLVASRLTNVFSGVATFVITFFIGKELFIGKIEKYVFPIFISFLPQYSFLSSYLNNDGFSVFCSSIILYAWIKGAKTGWDIKSCVLLGIGIGFIAITYYFAYAWILCSFIAFFSTIDYSKKKCVLKKFLMVFIVAFLIAGWYFIRNLIIYDGDLLGMKSMYTCAEQHAMEKYKPSNRNSYFQQGFGISSILFNHEWLRTSVYSYFAVFGGMNVFTSTIVYNTYIFIVLVGVLGFILYLIKNFKKDTQLYLYMCLLLCIIIPVCFTVYYSWKIDYQPQGRYVISSLVALMVFIIMGYSYLFSLVKKRELGLIIVGAIWIVLFIFCYKTMAYDQCWSEKRSIEKDIPNFDFSEELVNYWIDEETDHTIQGWAFRNNDKADVYLEQNGVFYKAQKKNRIDVKRAFDLKKDSCGFYLNIPNTKLKYKLLFVDFTEQKIYILKSTYPENIVSSEDWSINESGIKYFIDVDKVENNTRLLRGWAFSEDIPCDIYIHTNEMLYIADIESRPDVQKTFSLESDKCGFSVSIPKNQEVLEIVLINRDTRIIYKQMFINK